MKAYQVSKFVEQPDLEYGIFLLFGPNQGLIFENSQKLIEYYQKKSTEQLNLITLESAQILETPHILAQEAQTIPMFGGLVLIRVRAVTNRLTPIIKLLLEDNPQAIIILEAQNVKNGDKLVKMLENYQFGRTLPCYLDDERSISDYILLFFSKENIKISRDAIAALKNILGNDREIMRRELEKLALFAAQTKNIELENIIALCGDNSNITIDKVIDAIGTGHVAQFDREISKALNSGIDAQRLLISALNHFLWLRQMRFEIDKGALARNVLGKQRPRPHFLRTNALEQQLRIFTDERLKSACERIYQAIYESRKSPILAPTITKRALLAICVASARY